MKRSVVMVADQSVQGKTVTTQPSDRSEANKIESGSEAAREDWGEDNTYTVIQLTLSLR